MRYSILLEYNNRGCVLFLSNDETESLRHFQKIFNEIENKQGFELLAYYSLLPIEYFYRINFNKNLIVDCLDVKSNEEFCLYLTQFEGDFNHNEIKRQFNNYYSQSIRTLDGIIYLEANLN